MKRYLTLVLFILLIVSGCKNKDVEDIELSPSSNYPYVYTPLNQQEMAQKLLEFNAVNTFESLKLNEYGMVDGSIPVDLSAGKDSTTIKNVLLQMIKTYAPFLGITNSDSIQIETDISVHLDGGVNIHLNDYFQHMLEASRLLYFSKINGRIGKWRIARYPFIFQKKIIRCKFQGVGMAKLFYQKWL